MQYTDQELADTLSLCSGSAFLSEMKLRPPSGNYYVISDIRLRQSMRIYLNNPAEFHHHPIWNDFFEEAAQQEEQQQEQ